MQTTLPAQTSPPAQGSSWTPDRAVDLIADHVQSSLAWYGNRAVLHRALTPAETQSMKERLAKVRRSLMSTNGETERQRVGRAIAAALAGYGAADQSTVAAYSRLLCDLPVWAVELACDDVRRGAATNVNPAFAPKSPEIFKLAREKMEAAVAERDRLTLLLTAPVEEIKPPPTAEERARVEASLKKFHQGLGTDNPVEAEKRKAERLEIDRRKAERDEHTRRMDYILQGFEPPTNKHGVTMSISLARAMGLELKRRKPAPAPQHEFSPGDGE